MTPNLITDFKKKKQNTSDLTSSPTAAYLNKNENNNKKRQSLEHQQKLRHHAKKMITPLTPNICMDESKFTLSSNQQKYNIPSSTLTPPYIPNDTITNTHSSSFQNNNNNTIDHQEFLQLQQEAMNQHRHHQNSLSSISSLSSSSTPTGSDHDETSLIHPIQQLTPWPSPLYLYEQDQFNLYLNQNNHNQQQHHHHHSNISIDSTPQLPTNNNNNNNASYFSDLYSPYSSSGSTNMDPTLSFDNDYLDWSNTILLQQQQQFKVNTLKRNHHSLSFDQNKKMKLLS